MSFGLGVEQVLFWVFALASCFGAFGVLLAQNVVRMAFWLIVSLGSVSALFFLLHADFLGSAQLLVYVGGTVVVLIFGVMLTASGPLMQIKTSPAEGFIGAGVGLLLLFVLQFTVGSVDWQKVTKKLPPSGAVLEASTLESESGAQPGPTQLTGADWSEQAGRTIRPLGFSFFGLRPDADLNRDSKDGPLTPGYLLPFEIVSVHLLVVLIGASYLARAKRRATQQAL